MSETKLDHSYGLLIARVALIHRLRISEYLSEHNLYVGQEMLLKCLWNQDGLSQKEIADLMGIQAATVTRMVIRMERAGFVERKTDLEDQRVSLVYLTDLGRSLQSAVEEGWIAIEQYHRYGLYDPASTPSQFPATKSGTIISTYRISEVVRSNNVDFAPGEMLYSWVRWETFTVVDELNLQYLQKVKHDIDPVYYL